MITLLRAPGEVTVLAAEETVIAGQQLQVTVRLFDVLMFVQSTPAKGTLTVVLMLVVLPTLSVPVRT